MEIDEAANYIRDLIDPEAEIFWGSAIDPLMRGKMRVSIVATGLDVATEGSRAQQSVRAKLPAAVLPFTADSRPAALRPPSPTAETLMDEPALADLFAVDPAPTASIADAEEVLLLNSHNMRSTIISASMTHDADDSIGECDAPSPRGPTLFERVAALARGGGKVRLESSFPLVPERVEFPGVYNRRLPQIYSMRA
jgi:hypothetical protein